MVVGLTAQEVVARIPDDASVAFIYASQLICHTSVVEIIHSIKQLRPGLPVVVLENTQAVTAYSLKEVGESLFSAGADYLLLGEGELRGVAVAEWFESAVTSTSNPYVEGLWAAGEPVPDALPGFITDLDSLPFPAWELFPLDNYWSIGFSHGPLSSKRYLPLLTSRGCPFPCKFCVIPATSNRKWRGRSAGNVVAEMAHWRAKLQVEEFHIEDVNPTIQDKRIREMCREILKQRLPGNMEIGRRNQSGVNPRC